MTDAQQLESMRHLGWAAVSAAFGSLGRFCMALDGDFRVLHTSERLDQLLGHGARESITGKPIAALLGNELFGRDGALRQKVAAGRKCEGWRATLRLEPEGSRLVSVTAARLIHDAYGVCDREAHYIVVIRPAEEDPAAAAGPTALGGMIARSSPMLRIARLIEQLQQADTTVLLTGESGTGKEVVARAIHQHSTRRDGPFVAVNCGALPGELLESELFGHARGAFTGSVRDRVGRFELASKGTLFLDEIGDMPLPLQVKLLRVLQEHTFERIGENVSRKSNARIVAATNVDLARAVAVGSFREDLFYRLRVVPIEIPPLRNRRADIEPLTEYLLARVGARGGRALRLSPDAARVLLSYEWPGNVRELENALEFAVAVCEGQTIHPEDLPKELTERGAPHEDPTGAAAELERKKLRRVLEKHHWRRDEAAVELGMSRTTLWRKMRELGVRR
ncbi:MAG: sigma-54-dependent Fis family transcriptional regulator [Deltaproteobacteria bacterium]|nr:sigma-54-dependent Fis family transcriptional regulator [Deltaproteobacteria bacterium]